MLRLAARAPCRSGPVTSTLGIANTMFLRHTASLIDAARRSQLSAEFLRRADGVNLAAPDESFRAAAKDDELAGIYLWTVRPGRAENDEHVIYVGRTNSLSRRIAEYLRGFQPHSVNDFKLQAFQEQLLSACGACRLALYFKPHPVKDLAKAETAAIRTFSPVLNERMKADPEAQKEFCQAFKRYYATGFIRYLPVDSDA